MPFSAYCCKVAKAAAAPRLHLALTMEDLQKSFLIKVECGFTCSQLFPTSEKLSSMNILQLCLSDSVIQYTVTTNKQRFVFARSLLVAFFHRGEGQGSAPLKQFSHFRNFCPPPEIWSENNRKISITIEICITIDFAPLKKIPGRKPGYMTKKCCVTCASENIAHVLVTLSF